MQIKTKKFKYSYAIWNIMKLISLVLIITLILLVGCEKIDYTTCNTDSNCILIPENGRSACGNDYEGVAINKIYLNDWIDDKFSDLEGTACMIPGKFLFINKKAICQNNKCIKVDSPTNSTSFSSPEAEKISSMMNN